MNKDAHNFYELDGHSIEEYERSHKARLDFLVEDLKLNEVKGGLLDFGCGYGGIFKRLTQKDRYFFIGFDGDTSGAAEEYCKYRLVDLNNYYPGSKAFNTAVCFETLEHLSNPYNLLCTIKSWLKDEGTLYLSIPHQDCTHNTIYPGLLYPVENFKEFLAQMAFEIVDHRIHDKAFKQHVFILKNKPWSDCKMKWHKGEEKFRNKTPQEQVNL